MVYKTITKLMANRIATVIPNLVDPAQGALIEERNDNTHLAQQLVRRYGRKTSTPDV